MEERAKKKLDPLALTSSPPSPSTPAVIAPTPVVVAPVLPRVVQAQLSYGTVGAISDDYALLHTGGNHYVALIRTG